MISVLQFDVRLCRTKDEMLDAVRRAQPRRAGKLRLIIQTAALLAVAGWSLIAFFGDGMKDTMSAVIGLAALVLIPVMWCVPGWYIRKTVKDAEEQGVYPRLWVFDDGIDFGEEPPAGAYYPFGSFRMLLPDEKSTCQTMVLVFENDEIVVVPKALLSSEQWEFLVKKGG